MKTISNSDLLLIRACKRNDVKLNTLRRIVARKCAIPFQYVNQSDVAHHLLKIVQEYNLIRNWDEFLIERLNPKKWWTNEEKPYMDNLINELVILISLTEVKIFPRYPPNLYHSKTISKSMNPKLIKLPVINTAVRRDTISSAKISKNLDGEWLFKIFYMDNETTQNIFLGKCLDSYAEQVLQTFVEEYNS